MEVSSKCAIAIMAKAPEPGEVKTRLCPPLSLDEAARLYRCFLLDKIDQVKALKVGAPAIAYTPDHARALFAALVTPNFRLIPQEGPDLGARILNTLNRLIDFGHSGAVAVGSDTPTLPLAYLETAVSLLAAPAIDVVLGPSQDGGYYLIGLRKLHPELFEQMQWSTAEVFSETMRRARAKGLRVACLPPWYDVDTPEDLRRLKETLRLNATSDARQTKRLLMEWQQ
jgi:rSAM/selenodomain-associated transferase 1